MDRFLSRQEISPSAFFVPRKAPESGRWRPGLLSLRRQSQLASVAFEQGRLHEISRGSSKVQKLEKRMADAKAVSDISEDALSWTRQNDKSNTRMEMKRLAIVHSRQLIASKGPYSGRKGPAFKGTKQQRQLKARKEDVRRRIDGMDKVIETWRVVSVLTESSWCTI